MRTVNDFLNEVQDRQRAALAYGMKLDVMVLHVSFNEPLMRALALSPACRDAWELRQCAKEEERKDLFLYGVKVMWSGDRLPARQVWYRYSNPSFKSKGTA